MAILIARSVLLSLLAELIPAEREQQRQWSLDRPYCLSEPQTRMYSPVAGRLVVCIPAGPSHDVRVTGYMHPICFDAEPLHRALTAGDSLAELVLDAMAPDTTDAVKLIVCGSRLRAAWAGHTYEGRAESYGLDGNAGRNR
jgi:hypothetical protein